MKLDRTKLAAERLEKNRQTCLRYTEEIQAAYQRYRHWGKTSLITEYRTYHRISDVGLKTPKADLIAGIMEARWGRGWGVVFEKTMKQNPAEPVQEEEREFIVYYEYAFSPENHGRGNRIIRASNEEAARKLVEGAGDVYAVTGIVEHNFEY